MSETLYVNLYDDEDFRSDCINRAVSSYWIYKLLLDDDGMKLSMYVAISLAKKTQRIKDYIKHGILTFAPYKKALLIRSSLCTAEREIESISIEDNQFVIKFKQS